jgi:hypothetical protein
VLLLWLLAVVVLKDVAVVEVEVVVWAHVFGVGRVVVVTAVVLIVYV